MEDSRQEELEEEVNATTGSFICEICVESVSENKKFKTKNHCVHHFCVNCIAKYIETKITENTVKIKCPGLDCQQVLDPISCREIIPQSIFSKWCDVLCDNYILGFERSYCPNRNCRELVVNECGYGCEEGRNMRDRNDILFGQLVEKKAWIRCPGCGHCIEHRDGCFVITCRCNTHLCYKCGKELVAASSYRYPLLESQEEDADASFTCEICIEPVLTNKKFKNKNHCAHSFCNECIAEYIELKIEDHVASVQCPG
ncbi:hypothetical protein Pint_26010 [Pistacia integerrima]|uniref:Uncharacterized protein n=1 Tax=Pistacia integerrima TaxID=434235 RepID=A0ACC0YFJ8_9ROSI|nr:hypothetical protein Pint_26010 [Pistacia integerrima]